VRACVCMCVCVCVCERECVRVWGANIRCIARYLHTIGNTSDHPMACHTIGRLPFCSTDSPPGKVNLVFEIQA
jgi:hypothetical protein